MKNSIKSIVAIGLLLFSFSSLQAQKKVKVDEEAKTINKEKGNALKVVINRSTEKDISKAWKKKMKDYNGSVKTSGNEINATEVNIESISKYPIQVFAAVEKKKKENQHEFYVIFLNGTHSISKSSDVSGFTAAKDILVDFANEISKEATAEYLESQEDILDDMKDNLKDLNKATEDAKEDIEEKKEEIEELKSTISENEKKRETLTKKISEQEKGVKSAKNEVDLFD